MTRIAFGMLGLAALGAAIVVGTFVAFDVFGKNELPFSSPIIPLDAIPNEVRPSALTASAVDIGETVTAGDVSWTVTEANKVHEVCKYTFPPECVPGDFVTLTFEVENVSEEPVTLAEEELTLVDSEGRVYRAEPDINNAFVEHEKNVLFGEASLLEPGQKKEGKANFQVLPETSGYRAHLGDTDPTTSEGEYVSLGI